MQFDPSVRNIFLDIDDLYKTPQGKKVINAMMASLGEMYRTKRGHLAIGIRLETFEKLRKQLSLEIADGLDGLKVLSISKAKAA